MCSANSIIADIEINTKKWVEKPEATYPDEEGVWGTLLLIPAELHAPVVAGLN
jgi:hypothetical protein